MRTGERPLHTGEVVGSIPTAPTIASYYNHYNFHVVQFRVSVRAQDIAQETID